MVLALVARGSFFFRSSGLRSARARGREGCFDYSSGIIKGEQPLIRASRASKVAGAFLVLFWHTKENLALP